MASIYQIFFLNQDPSHKSSECPQAQKWGEAIRSKLVIGLFDSDTFLLTENPLPVDGIIPTKLAFKTKLNSYESLDKLKARFCLRGHM